MGLDAETAWLISAAIGRYCASVAGAEDVTRRDVWDALASPRLDTGGLGLLDFASDILGRSGLPLGELRRIDRTEVAPALWNEAFYVDWIVTEETLNRIESFLARPA